ncbi:MAG: RlmE family RNA methyltransferase [Proteobacteria bacterium]|nr:RlmE family RNA methyltransferase [Burkholderiales bacterium]
MARTASSKKWLREHENDTYVQRARKDGYRSRAIYKLIEIDDKDRLLRPGAIVVDLGAAPGSWSQLAARRVQPGGRVYALDLLPMEPLAGVEFVLGDFTTESVLRDLEARLGGRRVDLVLSDMAPNISGVASMDQARAVDLAELALEFALGRLGPEGAFLVKTFQGAGHPGFRQRMLESFETVASRKPAASRDRSSEQFMLGRRPRAQPDPEQGEAGNATGKF